MVGTFQIICKLQLPLAYFIDFMRPAAFKCILLPAFPPKIAEIVKLVAIKSGQIGQVFFLKL